MGGLGVFPDIAVGLVEEEGGVAGIFGIDVDLTRQQSLAHDLRAAQLQPPFDRQSRILQRQRDDIAKKPALGVDLRRDGDIGQGGAGQRARQSDSRKNEIGFHGEVGSLKLPALGLAETVDVKP